MLSRWTPLFEAALSGRKYQRITNSFSPLLSARPFLGFVACSRLCKDNGVGRGAALYVATKSIASYVLKRFGSALPASRKQSPSSGIKSFECSLLDAMRTGPRVPVPAEGSTPRLRTCTSQPGRAVVCWRVFVMVAGSYDPGRSKAHKPSTLARTVKDVTCPVTHEVRRQRQAPFLASADAVVSKSDGIWICFVLRADKPASIRLGDTQTALPPQR